LTFIPPFAIIGAMLKIRLQRVGRKHDPQFRIVVTEHTRAAKKGNIVENIGSFNPKLNTRVVDAERAKYWMSVGAQPSDAVHNILVTNKVIKAAKKNVLPKKTPIVKAEPEEEKAEAAAPAAAVSPDIEKESAPEEPKEVAAEEAPATEEPKDEPKEEVPAIEEPKKEPKEEVAEEAATTEASKEESSANEVKEEGKEKTEEAAPEVAEEKVESAAGADEAPADEPSDDDAAKKEEKAKAE
jgi:ribosomal protein S16